MELSVLNVIIVMLVCAMTAFMSHMGMAVFHDGIRPVIPEYIEGRMHRGEMASIAFGLSWYCSTKEMACTDFRCTLGIDLSDRNWWN